MSKIKLLAIAPFDGWCYIEEKEKIYLFKPPYKDPSNKIAVEKDDVTDALNKHEFLLCNQDDFNSYSELIFYLIQQKKELNEQKGRELFPVTDKDILEFYSYASKEQLKDLAEKINVKLLRTNEVFIAIEFIEKLLSLKNVQSDDELEALFTKLKFAANDIKQAEINKVKKKFLFISMDIESLIKKQNNMRSSNQVLEIA